MVVFEEITENEARITESLKSNYEVWGPPLSLEQYLEREGCLHDIHTRNGLAHRTFALLREDSNHIIAACEVLTRPLYNAGGGLSKDHCIASVFTHPDYRNHGYANDMLRQVVSLYDIENNNNQLSLWSDVGDYYSRLGFIFPTNIHEGPVWSCSLICRAPESMKYTSDCEILSAADTISQIIPEHQRLLLRETDLLYKECNYEISISAVLPHVGLYEQLQFRALFTAECLGIPRPDTFSARTVDGHGWISWTYMFPTRKLLVLGLFGSANEKSALLASAAQEGAKYDCAVELYESSIIEQDHDIEELVAALSITGLDAELIERETSLPMSISSSVYASPGGYSWY